MPFFIDQLEAQVLVKYFGIQQLKQWQMSVIQATIEGQNTVVIHTTGSGKASVSSYHISLLERNNNNYTHYQPNVGPD